MMWCRSCSDARRRSGSYLSNQPSRQRAWVQTVPTAHQTGRWDVGAVASSFDDLAAAHPSVTKVWADRSARRCCHPREDL